MLELEPRGYVINICCLKHLDVCKFLVLVVYFVYFGSYVVLFLPLS
jgi:hypothetical protein